jgi:cytochrome c oxidase assembly protein subunit 15
VVCYSSALVFIHTHSSLHSTTANPTNPQEPENKHAVPRVSPYRLAAHLTSAFAIYTTLVWTTLSLAHPTPALAAAAPAAAAAAAALRRRALPLAALVGVTAVSGAFVAGMDAGRAFNTFPMMNGGWIPSEYFESGLPWLRNAFENTAAVQLHHRALALSTLTAVAAVWAGARGAPLPAGARAWLNGVALATSAQVALGITTLLTYVPAPLGAAHQAGAMVLFTMVLGLLHAVRPAAAGQLARAVGRAAPPLGLAATAAIAYRVTHMN